ncbi:MAG: DUF885 domain-containing protein [Actinomycetota bacterium]|nr:DUF885 domain-containing protein [Actinomycetota bacterium]
MASQPLPERYVQLGLRLGRHLDGLVDGYFGPPELKDAVDAEEPAEPDALQEEATALLAELADWDDPDRQRRRWLTAQVEGLVCVAELVGGVEVPWREAVRRCYGIDVQPVPEEQFAAAHELLDAALPGDGELAERIRAWQRSQEVPAELLVPALDALIELLRSETEALVELPDGERIDTEIVTGEPWSAYNWYLGDRKSHIQISTDFPIRSYFLAELVAHEGYPGHHTEHSCKEARLLGELGRVEHSILLIHTPECLVSEGIAQVAIEQALGDDWPGGAAAALRPLSIPFDADTARAVVHAYHHLDDLPVNVAYFVSEEGWSEEQAVAYQQRWALSEEERARKSVAFAMHPVWGIYVPTYAHGYRLVRSAALPFRRLLTEPITTADLLDARVA